MLAEKDAYVRFNKRYWTFQDDIFHHNLEKILTEIHSPYVFVASDYRMMPCFNFSADALVLRQQLKDQKAQEVEYFDLDHDTVIQVIITGEWLVQEGFWDFMKNILLNGKAKQKLKHYKGFGVDDKSSVGFVNDQHLLHICFKKLNKNHQDKIKSFLVSRQKAARKYINHWSIRQILKKSTKNPSDLYEISHMIVQVSCIILDISIAMNICKCVEQKASSVFVLVGDQHRENISNFCVKHLQTKLKTRVNRDEKTFSRCLKI